MGRIKMTPIKTLGDQLIREHTDKFSVDFEKNKVALGDLKEIKSKKIRNILAGYITKEMQKLKKSDVSV